MVRKEKIWLNFSITIFFGVHYDFIEFTNKLLTHYAEYIFIPSSNFDIPYFSCD